MTLDTKYGQMIDELNNYLIFRRLTKKPMFRICEEDTQYYIDTSIGISTFAGLITLEIESHENMFSVEVTKNEGNFRELCIYLCEIIRVYPKPPDIHFNILLKSGTLEEGEFLYNHPSEKFLLYHVGLDTTYHVNSSLDASLYHIDILESDKIE